MANLPPCGVYRTTKDIPSGPAAGKLVYFHNHGNPGPGVYVPTAWKLNRAQWSENGTILPDDSWVKTLEQIPSEGFYRVRESFTCCDKKCQTFPPELLVQLGYNGNADPILFVPQWGNTGFTIPESGSMLDRNRVFKLIAVQVSTPPQPGTHTH
jgi:hypothetical protein